MDVIFNWELRRDFAGAMNKALHREADLLMFKHAGEPNTFLRRNMDVRDLGFVFQEIGAIVDCWPGYARLTKLEMLIERGASRRDIIDNIEMNRKLKFARRRK